jgi:hypothetical protein
MGITTDDEFLFNLGESIDSIADDLGAIPLMNYEFGQESNFNKYKRQQNLIALKNKEVDRIFQGLSTAGSPSPTPF